MRLGFVVRGDLSLAEYFILRNFSMVTLNPPEYLGRSRSRPPLVTHTPVARGLLGDNKILWYAQYRKGWLTCVASHSCTTARVQTKLHTTHERVMQYFSRLRKRRSNYIFSTLIAWSQFVCSVLIRWQFSTNLFRKID